MSNPGATRHSRNRRLSAGLGVGKSRPHTENPLLPQFSTTQKREDQGASGSDPFWMKPYFSSL
jgi:hypothetical protein